MLRNVTTRAVTLTRWTVRDNQRHVYTFGTFTLAPSKTVVLHTVKGMNTTSVRYWGMGHQGLPAHPPRRHHRHLRLGQRRHQSPDLPMATSTRALYALLGATALLGAATAPSPNLPPRPAVPVERQLADGGGDLPFDPALAAVSCPIERGPVKRGSDADRYRVNTTTITTSISYLTGRPQPSSYPRNNRIAPTELHTWTLNNVRLTQYKLESDGDLHLVLKDSAGRRMIAAQRPQAPARGRAPGQRPRPGHPRHPVRDRPAAVRARGAGPRRRRPVRPQGARHRQGRQGWPVQAGAAQQPGSRGALGAARPARPQHPRWPRGLHRAVRQAPHRPCRRPRPAVHRHRRGHPVLRARRPTHRRHHARAPRRRHRLGRRGAGPRQP